MKQAGFGVLLAMQFLTRLPIPINCPWNKQTSRWAIRSYPLVGMLLGLILFVFVSTLYSFLPQAMMALLILSIWVWLTGGLHLDGLMDVADAVGSNASLKKKWEIMKDPHVGSFAIIALFFLLVWKGMFIYYLLDISTYSNLIFLIVILSVSRFGAVMLLVYTPVAKKQGLASDWKKNINTIDVVIAIVPVILLVIFEPKLLIFISTYFIFIVIYRFWAVRTFKGVNGDLLGTAIEGGELWGLVTMWIYISFVMG